MWDPNRIKNTLIDIEKRVWICLTGSLEEANQLAIQRLSINMKPLMLKHYGSSLR
jgi:hypothetical protein|nr:MAG TPA: hypothetical protein [Caudoviricetes sp.]